MDITVTLSLEDHDLVLRNLREDLTVQEWIQAALDGKVSNCRKREYPEAIAQREAAVAQRAAEELRSQLSTVQAENVRLTEELERI